VRNCSRAQFFCYENDDFDGGNNKEMKVKQNRRDQKRKTRVWHRKGNMLQTFKYFPQPFANMKLEHLNAPLSIKISKSN